MSFINRLLGRNQAARAGLARYVELEYRREEREDALARLLRKAGI